MDPSRYNMNRHFRRLEQGIRVPLLTDEEGFVGRECPNADCLGYFLIKPGTGLVGADLPCHCPYCGHTAPQNHFHTPEQLEYGRSILIREAQKAIGEFAKDLDRQLRQQTRGGFVQLRVDYRSHPHLIRYYREKRLETYIVCDECTLAYKIYGVFAYCPDCGIHNSLQIL